jgi:hypothetical protein
MEADLDKLEAKMIRTSLGITLMTDLFILIITYLLNLDIDGRLLAGLVLLSLVIHFLVVEPGIRKTCEKLKAKRLEKKIIPQA